MTTIVAAAIRVPVPEEFRDIEWNGKQVYPYYLTISSPPPARHSTLMHPFITLSGTRIPANDQGFLTSTGEFVDRKQAYKIAIAAGQPMIDHSSRVEGTLYSEDLW